MNLSRFTTQADYRRAHPELYSRRDFLKTASAATLAALAAGAPRLRFSRSCSSALAPATLEKVEAACGAPVLEAYAMTGACVWSVLWGEAEEKKKMAPLQPPFRPPFLPFSQRPHTR